MAGLSTSRPTHVRDSQGVIRGLWPLVGRSAELAAIERFVDRAGGSIVFSGPAGAGKTRLIGEVEQRATEAGCVCLRVVASQSAQPVPLGAFASLLAPPALGHEAPTNVIADAVAFVGRYAERLDPRAPLDRRDTTPAVEDDDVIGYQLARRIVLVVDDAQWLDGASAALVQQLVVGGVADVAATIRSGERVPDAITALWKDGTAERVEVGPLSRASIEELIADVLPEATSRATTDVLWRACEGNPLYLRELVLGAIDSGTLLPDGVGWHVAGPLTRSPRLVELVEARLADLSDEQRSVLELLAVSGPIGLGLLISLVSVEAAEAVERRGLAVTRTEGRRREIQLAHPLHGEVLRSQLPALTAMGINRRLAAAVEGLGARRRDDIMRVAVWRLEGGGRGQPEVLLLAASFAHAARNEILAERLARSAMEAGAGADATLLLGVVLGELGRLHELEDLLAGLAKDGDLDDRTRAIVACKRALNILWGLQRAADAASLLQVAEAALPPGPARDEIVAERAVVAVLSGCPDHALELAMPLADSPDERVAVRAALALSPALRVAGRPAEAVAVADRGWTLQNNLADHRGFGSAGTNVIFRVSAMTELGEVSGAGSLADLVAQVTADSGDAVGMAWAAWVAGGVALDAGRVAESADSFARAESGWASVGQVTQARWAATGRLFATVMRGDLAGVAAMETDLRANVITGMTIEESPAQRALAWALWLRGDERGATDRLVELVDEAQRRGAILHALQAAHDLARLGAATQAQMALTKLVLPPDWPMGEARGAHIMALGAADGPGLLEVSDRFEALGWSLYAAEAAAQAAGVHRRARERRKADRAAAQSARILERCEGAITPALAEVGDAASLSSREREIAGLAALALSNRDIAAQLGLSERTIENHLQRAYVKLGVTARTQLAEALRRADPADFDSGG